MINAPIAAGGARCPAATSEVVRTAAPHSACLLMALHAVFIHAMYTPLRRSRGPLCEANAKIFGGPSHPPPAVLHRRAAAKRDRSPLVRLFRRLSDTETKRVVASWSHRRHRPT